MKAELVIVLFILGTVHSDMAGECDMAGFYLELGCTPLPKSDNSSACPDAFTCPDLHPDPNMCYYRGVPYGDGSTIPQALINNRCSTSCSCEVYIKPRIQCAVIDCRGAFYPRDEQQCIRTQRLDSCCSGTICDEDEIAKLKTCEVDGKTYKEGQSYEVKNTSKTCICTAQFNGTLNNPAYCRDLNCGIEIHYQSKIMTKCAPMYFEKSIASCPIGYLCPSPTSKVIRGLNERSISAQCVFGSLTLAVGDEVTVDESCTKCTCNVPPFVTCIKQYCD